jgi:hypothetical protein
MSSNDSSSSLRFYLSSNDKNVVVITVALAIVRKEATTSCGRATIITDSQEY